MNISAQTQRPSSAVEYRNLDKKRNLKQRVLTSGGSCLQYEGGLHAQSYVLIPYFTYSDELHSVRVLSWKFIYDLVVQMWYAVHKRFFLLLALLMYTMVLLNNIFILFIAVKYCSVSLVVGSLTISNKDDFRLFEMIK